MLVEYVRSSSIPNYAEYVSSISHYPIRHSGDLWHQGDLSDLGDLSINPLQWTFSIFFRYVYVRSKYGVTSWLLASILAGILAGIGPCQFLVRPNWWMALFLRILSATAAMAPILPCHGVQMWLSNLVEPGGDETSVLCLKAGVWSLDVRNR